MIAVITSLACIVSLLVVDAITHSPEAIMITLGVNLVIAIPLAIWDLSE